MLQIKNKTSFITQIIPGLDKNEYEYATVILKGTFTIAPKKEALALAEDQMPVTLADQYYGEPGASSIQYASDTIMLKKGTDIVLIGHAYSRRPADPFVDVTLQVGNVARAVRVFGDRQWIKSLGSWKASAPKSFEKIPLRYERAFGGKDTSDPDPARHGHEKRNPVGTGFFLPRKDGPPEGAPMPNLEDARFPINGWEDKPSPAGFGFIAPDWMPRMSYAGTYDEKWRETRCPFLPEDFNDLFFNSASPELISSKYLKGGEQMRITGASKSGELLFKLPEKKFLIDLYLKGKKQSAGAVLDTVIVEPDENRVLLTWRATIPVFRQILYIDHVIIKESK